MEDLFRVGAIANTHGIRGEVKVYPTTDDPSRFKKIKEVIMDPDGLNMTLHITSARFQKNLVIVKFKEFDNINQVEGYKKLELYVTRDNATPLEEDEYYIADLLDLEVITDEGDTLGVVCDVLQTGANDVYVVQTDEGQVLLPATYDCVLDIDLDKQVMLVHIMPGLLD